MNYVRGVSWGVFVGSFVHLSVSLRSNPDMMKEVAARCAVPNTDADCLIWYDIQTIFDSPNWLFWLLFYVMKLYLCWYPYVWAALVGVVMS